MSRDQNISEKFRLGNYIPCADHKEAFNQSTFILSKPIGGNSPSLGKPLCLHMMKSETFMTESGNLRLAEEVIW